MSAELFAVIFIFVVLSGVFIVFMGLRQRSEQLAMLHRERMAMIERGLTPGPEGLAGLEGRPRLARGERGSRSMSLGIIVVALGLGLMSVIGIAAGAPEIGVGLGGAILMIGIAFIVRSVVIRGDAPGDAARGADDRSSSV